MWVQFPHLEPKMIRLRITTYKNQKEKAVQAITNNCNFSSTIAEMIVENGWIFSVAEKNFELFKQAVANSNIEWMVMQS
jgi:hypothetical protein